MLKSWVRGERLVGEGETIGTGGSDGGGEIPAAGTDTEDGSGGEGREGCSWEERPRLAESLV